MIKKIFFVGIKGVGMAPLAIISKQAGFDIEGADLAEEFITDKYLNVERIKIHTEFSPKILEKFFGETNSEECLVITTGAHGGFNNPISLWAKEHKYKVLSLGQALGEFMNGSIFNRADLKGVSIAGSHGKTTIASLLATSLEFLNQDISYTVGTGELFPLGSPGKYGKGELFVVEADEYASEPVNDKTPKLLYQFPHYVIINNIDFDHPDIFESIDDIENVFATFFENVNNNGVIFINGDDARLQNLKQNTDRRVVTYGEGENNDFVIKDIKLEGLASHFLVTKKGEKFGEFELSVPGRHNAVNSLSVIAFLDEIGFNNSQIEKALKEFKGTKRRTEVIGATKNGILAIDDYAHHPVEILTTLKSIKTAYPTKKIICIFQPHTFSRTKALLSEFAKSFENASELILMPVFASQRDTENDKVSYDEYVKAYRNFHKNVIFIENASDVVKYIEKNYTTDEFIVVTMGAGDVYHIGREIIKI